MDCVKERCFSYVFGGSKAVLPDVFFDSHDFPNCSKCDGFHKDCRYYFPVEFESISPYLNLEGRNVEKIEGAYLEKAVVG